MNYKIGLSFESMDYLENLGIEEPYGRFFLSEGITRKASGKIYSKGLPFVTWNWGYLLISQRNILRNFCPGFSSDVFIRTRILDGKDIFQSFRGIMEWPTEEDPDHNTKIRPNFSIKFSRLELIDAEDFYLGT